MSEQNDLKLVVVGSIGIDTIETPFDRRESILGGSASYACAAASFYTGVGMVGVVGADFPAECEAVYRSFRIDLEGLQKKEGKTFRWSGVYLANMDQRETLSTDLNVFADFSPELPLSYRAVPFLFLGNISPTLQTHVLDQAKNCKFVAMDTMDLWINVEREELLRVIARVDMLTLNESEARHLTGQHFLPAAAKTLLAMGPQHVLIKKGEHGSMLFSGDKVFVLPAYPLHSVTDPTGAGDVFAGGFMGALAAGGRTDEDAIRSAMVYGSVTASFAVEAFSLDRLQGIDRAAIDARAAQLREMMRAPVV
jgi:sugar/nucleoside kinase (ribokinase family)